MMDQNEGAVFLTSLFVVTTSLYSLFITRSIISFLVLLTSSLFLTTLSVYSLSLIASERSTDQSTSKKPPPKTNPSLIWTTRFTGIIAAAYFLALPHYAPGGPLGQSAARAIFFACACKTLDLTVARARKPPVRIRETKLIPVTDQNRREYIWLLLRECRYRSFDIAIIEKDRIGPADMIWSIGPGIILPLLVYWIPCSETRFLLTLLIIHAGLESCHSILHPSSTNRLFWQPFAAGSISSFWKTHWQQDASSFLYSLAYAPARGLVGRRLGKQAGRAAGVMTAFNLSGIWHGWAAACLTTTPWRCGLGMWALFVAHGVLCLIESAIPKERQGGLVQRLLVWSFAIWSTGLWMRDAEKNIRVPMIRHWLE